MPRKLTRAEDKALWVETRLRAAYDEGRGRTVYSMMALKRKLEIAYERLHPWDHVAPTNVVRYGQRLSERSLALCSR